MIIINFKTHFLHGSIIILLVFFLDFTYDKILMIRLYDMKSVYFILIYSFTFTNFIFSIG